MTENLAPSPGVVVLTPENLSRVLVDMGADPGWMPSSVLYGWYSGMCAEVGGVAMSRKAFGATLRDLGYKPSIQRQGGKHQRGWFITRRAIRGSEKGKTG